MSTVAVVTCRRENVDPDQPLLLDALANEGIDARAYAWDDDSVAWNDFDLVVLRSPWDYATRRGEFLAWARSVDRLANAYEVIERNTDKHYLDHLASADVAVIATQFVDVGMTPRWPEGAFVVKPTVGAGSLDTERYDSSSHELAAAHVARLHDARRDVMVQPYVESVDRVGETALIFIDGEFTHAMNKAAMLNVSERDRNALFRREQMTRVTVTSDVVATGVAALAALDASELLYARVDLVELNGHLAVMEVELSEPSLFLSFRPDVATLFARAIARRVATVQ